MKTLTPHVISIRLAAGVYESLLHILPTLKEETGLPSMNAILATAAKELALSHRQALPEDLRTTLRLNMVYARAGQRQKPPNRRSGKKRP